MRAARAVAVFALALGVAACGPEPMGSEGQGGALSLKAEKSRLLAGEQVKINASVHAGDGAEVDVTAEVSWSSSNTAVATVEAGVVTAVSAGECEIIAVHLGQTVSTKLKIDARALVALELSSTDLRLALGADAKLKVMGVTGDGLRVDVSALVKLHAANEAILKVGVDGTLHALAEGQTTLTVELDGIVTTCIVTVVDLQTIVVSPTTLTLNVGTSAKVKVVGTTAAGVKVDVTAQALLDCDSSILEIGVDGRIKAKAAGNAVVKVRVGAHVALLNVEVKARAVVRTFIVVPDGQLAVGAQVKLKLMAELEGGVLVDVTEDAEWLSSDLDLCVVVGGVVRAKVAGQVTITAKFGGHIATTVLVCTEATAVKVEVTASTVHLDVGAKVKLKAWLHLSDGSVIDVTDTAIWVSANVNVAAVVGGECLGTGEGTTLITAKVGAHVGGLNLNVKAKVGAKVIAHLTLVADCEGSDCEGCGGAGCTGLLNLSVGAKVKLRVFATFTDGTVAEVTDGILWGCTSLLATCEDGLLEVLGAGDILVTAQVDGLSASLTVKAKLAVNVGVGL
jgi:hypothetical protein